MKAKSIIRLSFKNTTHNFGRSLKIIFIIILTSMVVITMGNFCYSYKSSADKALLKIAEEKKLIIKYNKFEGAKDGEFDFVSYFTDVYNFAPIAECDVSWINSTVTEGEEVFDIYAYLEDLTTGGEEVEMAEGERWTVQDMGKPYIYLSERLAEKKSCSVGDKIKLKFDNIDRESEFEVKGIVKGEVSYADYTYYNLHQLYITYDIQSPDMQTLKEFEKLYDKYYSQGSKHSMFSYLVSEIKYQDSNQKIVFAFGIFLMIMATGLCLFSIINVLKLSTMEGGRFIGILTALGAKRKDIRSYIFCCAFYPMVIALCIASAIAPLIGIWLFKAPTQALLELFFERPDIQATWTYGWFMPLICLGLMTAAVGVATLSLTSRKKLNNITDMISEAE